MHKTPTITLFVQCLVDGIYPEVAEAVVRIFRRLGFGIACPTDQTCCGQPAFNSGYHAQARIAAKRWIEIFEGAHVVVCPSGSCVNMVRHHYPLLLRDESRWLVRARKLAGRTFELTEYLVDVLGIEDLGAAYSGKITYHDSCHLLRGIGVGRQPRRLLRRVAGAELVEMDGSDRCCGFGGAFAVKYADISTAMVSEKADRVIASGADTLVGCDMGCLMNIEGMLNRRGASVRVLHIAQVLAG